MYSPELELIEDALSDDTEELRLRTAVWLSLLISSKTQTLTMLIYHSAQNSGDTEIYNIDLELLCHKVVFLELCSANMQQG